MCILEAPKTSPCLVSVSTPCEGPGQKVESMGVGFIVCVWGGGGGGGVVVLEE